MNRKVTIIGSGGVGSAIGYALTFLNQVDEIALVDVNPRAADGEALDIGHGIGAISTTSVRAGDYEDCRSSDIIVITAGINRKVGQSRDDLLEANRHIMDAIMDQMLPFYHGAFVIVVSNPVDYLTGYVGSKGFIPKNKLCGTGCLLDTSRWITELAKYLNVRTDRIFTYSVGKHGSGQRLLWSLTTVDGRPIDDFCKDRGLTWNDDIKARLTHRVTEMGADIIAKKGRTQFGIATSVAYLVRLLLRSEDTLVPVTHLLNYRESDEEPTSTLGWISDLQIKDASSLMAEN